MMMKKVIVFLLFFFMRISPCLAAVTFDGVDDYINCGTSSTLNFATSTSTFTLAAWVKATSYTFTFNGVVSKWLGTGSQRSWGFGVNNTDEVRFIISTDGATTAMGLITTGGTFSLNQWYHIAVTADVGSDTYLIYVDGTAKSTTGSTTISNAFSSTASVNIGSQKDGTDDLFTGTIEDVRVYNRALSAAEVEILAKSRLKYAPVTSGLVGYWPMDDCGDGTSGDGDTFVDRSGTGNSGTGVDGANNTGLTCRGSSYLSYP